MGTGDHVHKGKCPECKQWVGADPGGEVPIHTPQGKQGKCSGTGKKAVS